MNDGEMTANNPAPRVEQEEVGREAGSTQRIGRDAERDPGLPAMVRSAPFFNVSVPDGSAGMRLLVVLLRRRANRPSDHGLAVCGT